MDPTRQEPWAAKLRPWFAESDREQIRLRLLCLPTSWSAGLRGYLCGLPG